MCNIHISVQKIITKITYSFAISLDQKEGYFRYLYLYWSHIHLNFFLFMGNKFYITNFYFLFKDSCIWTKLREKSIDKTRDEEKTRLEGKQTSTNDKQGRKRASTITLNL